MEFRVKDSHAKAYGSGVPLISFEFLSKNRNAVSINTFTQSSGYLLRFARFASLHLNYISFFQQAHNRPKMICNLPFGEFRFKDGSNKNEKEEEMQICLPHLDRNHSSFSTESEKCKCQTERMITIETSDPQSPRMAMKLAISFNHFAAISWKTRELLCVYDKIVVESAFLMHTNACG